MLNAKAILAICWSSLLCISLSVAQEEISVELSGGASMEFVWVAPGAFIMGSLPEPAFNERTAEKRPI